MEGQEVSNTGSAANSSPAPQVLGTSMSGAFQAGDANDGSRTAEFDDIFAPPEAVSVSANPDEETPDTPDTQEGNAPPPPASDLMAQFAAEFGLDPANPLQAKLLRQMVDAQHGGTGQQPQQAAQAPGQEEDEDELTPYEKALLAEDPPAQAAQPVNGQVLPPQPQGLPPGKFGDVLDDTGSMEEAMELWRQAWTPDENDKVDMKKIGNIHNAVWIRQFAAMGIPVMRNFFQSAMQSEFGDAINYVRQFRDAEMKQRIYREVLQELRKQPGYEKLDDLFNQLSDKKIRVRKDEVVDTEINRVLREYPWILDMERYHENPVKALKLTHTARMRAVFKRWKERQQTVPVSQAKQLVEAGANAERKKQSDVSRQRINAGPGATGTGTQSSSGDWMTSLVRSNGGRTSVGDLLSRR